MNKILVNIYVPSISSSYDVYISTDSYIGDIKNILGNSIEKLSNKRFVSISNVLVDSITGKEFDDNLIVEETNIEKRSFKRCACRNLYKPNVYRAFVFVGSLHSCRKRLGKRFCQRTVL